MAAKSTPAAAKKATTQTAILTARLTLARETKNTVRYEDNADGAVLPLLYVPKAAFQGENYPNVIVVTVTAG